MDTLNATVINVQEIEPRLRHETIFQVFLKLQKGESLVIHNNHDPVPVYYQLQELYGDTFTWEYIQRGPEWWDVKVTKTVENVALLETEYGELVVNVPAIEPKYKHDTIFRAIGGLRPGDSLIIHNDHDPKPLYHQLKSLIGDAFTWDYLQEGPEWWDIRVRIKPIASTSSDTENAVVINVPSIEPRFKHDTIFRTYENLKPGEALIIHNDHDPKPVFYQLQHMHGDTFTWEYLSQGPEWWDIRVTKKGENMQNTETIGREGELVIDVPAITDHRLKHATIFEAFNSLKGGESFVIHNDHDPKPVFYQLQGMHGDTFTWEYLQEGPEWWDVRVTLQGEEENQVTIGEIVAKDLSKAEVFKKYGIDFCCNGNKTVAQACQEMGLDVAQIERELAAGGHQAAASALDFNAMNLDFLADYVVNIHHAYVRKNMPEIVGFASKIAQVHGPQHPELLQVKVLFDKVARELADHMVDEEDRLFPIVKEILAAKNNGTPYARSGSETFKAIVTEHFEEHEEVGDAMREIRRLTQDYTLPADACTTYNLTFKMLEEFESDLFTHIHLENNILFIKAMEIEETLV